MACTSPKRRDSQEVAERTWSGPPHEKRENGEIASYSICIRFLVQRPTHMLVLLAGWPVAWTSTARHVPLVTATAAVHGPSRPAARPAARTSRSHPSTMMTAPEPPTPPGMLILVRHGQSTWNDENRFTGWANVPLNDRGRDEAMSAANILLGEEDLRIDACYTSVLTQVGGDGQHLPGCVGAGRPPPAGGLRALAAQRAALRHADRPEQARGAGATSLRPTCGSGARRSMAARRRWRTAILTTAARSARYERLLAARTRREGEPEMSVLSLDDVPLTESLADTVTRVGSLWEAELLPQVQSGKNLLVVGHANCLRALISCIQGNLRDEHLPSLGVPNALPLVYDLRHGGRAPLARPASRGAATSGRSTRTTSATRAILFNELDADGSGALDASEFDDSAFCSVVWDDSRDDAASGDDSAAAAEEVGFASSCGESLLAEADNNNDGVVDFNEYMNWWSKLDSRSSGARRAPSRGAGRFRDTL